MKSDKFFVIVMAIIVGTIAALAFYYFSDSSANSALTKGNGNNSTANNVIGNTTGGNTSGGSTTNNTTGTGGSNRVSLSNVKDYNVFFTINSIINDYYKLMIDDNKSAILNVLDDNYIATHKINKNNVKNYMEQNYESISYISKYMYVKGANNKLYYFIKGEAQCYDFAAEILYEKEDVNYLVTVDLNNKSYSITPIVSSIVVFNYAQDYKMTKTAIESNSDNKYRTNDISDKNVTIYYLNYYKTMLYLNTEKAYNMLDSESKALYQNYEAFVNNLATIYDNLSTNLLSYSIRGDAGSRSYSAISTNQKRVDFFEKSIMDYTVNLTH